MDIDYFIKGYNLMMTYMREERILTKERNFRNRLDRFYNKHKDEEFLDLESERVFLQLYKYFFNNILKQTNNHEKGLVEFLNIISDVDY